MASRAPFTEAAEQLAQAFSRYSPFDQERGMYDMYQHLGQLPEALDQVAQGMRMFRQNADGWPLHPAVKDFLDAMTQAQRHLARAAYDIRPAIERFHEIELERHENPRPAEELWNTPGRR